MNDWIPRDHWDALVRGEDCPLCGAIAKTEALDEYGLTIADLTSGRLRLATNQFSPGYCVFINARHVCEPYDLTVQESTTFFADITRIAAALDRVFTPTKMNFQILGNAVPHLHCHIVPRYYGDPAPARPLDLDRPEHMRLLTPVEYEEWGGRIRGALASEGAL